MKNKLIKIKQQILNELENAENSQDVELLRHKYLSRKTGKLTQLIKEIKNLKQELRPVVGQVANDIKKEVDRAFEILDKKFAEKISEAETNQRLDITLPGHRPLKGSLHPITQVKNDLNDAFKFLGFTIYEGPEITSEAYAFDHLNFPSNHPARETMDTYWLAGTKNKTGLDKLCLRPHLTGASVRYMQNYNPPFRFVYPGRVFRNEATDAGHERCFYQWEALIVNENISIAGGKVLIKTILNRVFGRDVKIRMRTGFFPFVEPGFEIDMQCLNCGGKGCSVCKHNGWLEMMPGGPPHPNVLRAGGINPDKWQGFYINIGLDRLVMMKYGINDIRLLHSGDLRFLKQF